MQNIKIFKKLQKLQKVINYSIFPKVNLNFKIFIYYAIYFIINQSFILQLQIKINSKLNIILLYYLIGKIIIFLSLQFIWNNKFDL